MNRRIFPSMFAAALIGAVPSGYAAEPGQPVPDCDLKSLDGKSSVDLNQFKGRVLYVDFWASWCPPCARSFPFMNEIKQQFGAKGLQVLAINVDENTADAKAFLAKHAAHFDIAADSTGQCPQRFGVQAMPSSYLVDDKGVIRQVHVGFRAGEAAQLRATVEQLLNEQSPMQRSDTSGGLP